MRKRLITLLALTGLAAAAVGGSVASGEIVHLGNLTLEVDGGFTPTKLPKKKMAPIKLHAEGHVTTDDGSTPPIADHVTVDFDKNGDVDTKGLPQCDARKLQNTLTATAKRKCKDALVGKGFTEAIVDFPDQDPFVARGPLLAFNGKPKGGNPVIIFHVFAHVPAPTTFVVPAVISKSPLSGYGRRVSVDVPPISGGNGTLTDFNVNIKRHWTTKKHGKKVKHSYLVARCPNGRLKAQGEATWRDGTKIDVGIVRPCETEKKHKEHKGHKNHN